MKPFDFSITSSSYKAAPKITGVHPTGSLVLLELLTTQELTSNKILIADETEVDGPPQAYVLEVGPSSCETIKDLVGKRVIVQGRGVPVSNFDGNRRERMIVEYQMIKAELEEEKTLATESCCRAPAPEVQECCRVG